jgi:hypothetical protein
MVKTDKILLSCEMVVDLYIDIKKLYPSTTLMEVMQMKLIELRNLYRQHELGNLGKNVITTTQLKRIKKLLNTSRENN